MKKIMALIMVLAVLSLIVIGCQKAVQVATTQSASEEAVISQGLSDIDNLTQMDNDLKDINLNELDELTVE